MRQGLKCDGEGLRDWAEPGRLGRLGLGLGSGQGVELRRWARRTLRENSGGGWDSSLWAEPRGGASGLG